MTTRVLSLSERHHTIDHRHVFFILVVSLLTTLACFWLEHLVCYLASMDDYDTEVQLIFDYSVCVHVCVCICLFMFAYVYPSLRNRAVRIWNWQSRNCLAVLAGHHHYVMCATFHPGGEDILASASLDQTIRIWDLSGLREKTVSSAGRRGNALQVNSEVFGAADAVCKFILEGVSPHIHTPPHTHPSSDIHIHTHIHHTHTHTRAQTSANFDKYNVKGEALLS